MKNFKKLFCFMLCCILTISFVGCGNNDTALPQSSSDVNSGTNITDKSTTPPATSSTAETDTPTEEKSKVLVVYFSLPETTDPENMTQEEENSTVIINGEVLGNTQYMAYVIQENTNGDIFRIEPETPYTTNHEELVDLAKKEQQENARPKIKDVIEKFDSYDTVFVGYPNWWGDMPMILYTFFDTYDFSGKTIVTFNTHGGSGFSNTNQTITELEPDATVIEGLSISRNDIQEGEAEIIDWLKELGYTK